MSTGRSFFNPLNVYWGVAPGSYSLTAVPRTLQSDQARPLVLFDLDNTLLDRADVFRRWATAWASERALNVTEAVAWLESADCDGFVRREEFFALVKKHFLIPDEVEVLVAAYDRAYPLFVEPAPEKVTSALSQLKGRGYRVGIVTNGPASQQVKIARMGLGALVDGCAVSALVGANKPSPTIFYAAAMACGAGGDAWAQDAWMVGDNPEADIGGAQASGLRSVWVHRDRDWPTNMPRPDLVASDVVEAVQLILAENP